MNNNKSGENNKDWDLGNILPHKKPAVRLKRDVEAVSVDVADPEGSKNQTVKSSVIPARTQMNAANPNGAAGQSQESGNYKARPVCSYKPDNPLITNVNVWLWPSKFTFYERFRSDAERNFSRCYGECQHIKFFSYMPQYIQLDPKQYDWYFWWRDNVRRKVYLPTDFSYILLYIYEIINLPDLVPAEQGIELMCDVWLAYRETYKKMDRNLIEWICDYCLINKLPPPFGKFTDEIMNEIILQASFKEFFIKFSDDSAPYYSMLMQTSSNYEWTKSKYVNDENREMFEKYITEAFHYAAKRYIKDDHMTDAKITRDAFSGSLCAYNVKRRIDIEYKTFTRSAELRLIVSDIIKYAENKVRAMIGIKGRLSAPNLTNEIMDTLEEYFVQFKPVKNKTSSEEENEYSHLYEARSSEFSASNALEIEKQSWNITNALVDAFEPAKTQNDGLVVKPEKETVVASDPEPEAATDEKTDILYALKCIYYDDRDKFAELLEKNNMLEDSMIECINEYVYDIIGDIAVEAGDGWYIIISDYITEVEEIINGRATKNT